MVRSQPPAPARQKILPQARAALAVRTARRRGERVVFTNGCFDLVHTGHIRSLEEARTLGDRLVVAVNGDRSVARAKGPRRPALPALVRMEVIAALACVDWVVGFNADTPHRVIQALRPDILAKGGDWSMDEIVGREEVEEWGGRVVRLRNVPGLRSSEWLRRIRRRT